MTWFVRLIVLALMWAGLLREPLVAQTATDRSTAQSDLLRDRWVDSWLGIDHPLYEIVRIGRGESVATAAFIPNCRLLTTLRDLVNTRSSRRGTVTFRDVDLDFIGERFEFETKWLPVLGGKPAAGHFVVIATGQMSDPITTWNNGENWAIGYDEECLSEKFRLGHVLIGHAHEAKSLRSLEFMVASYGQSVSLEKPTLVIDPKCRTLTEQPQPGMPPDGMSYSGGGWLLTDCRPADAGLGQMLLRPLLYAGQPLLGPWGRPYLAAYGLVVATQSPQSPGGRPETRVMAFSDAVRAKFSPYLDGPVTFKPRRP